MQLDDPRLAQLIIELVDRRVRAGFQTEAATRRYGIVSSVDAATQRAAVFIGGSTTASPGFVFPPYLKPRVGDQVRVVINGADRYLEADLDLPGNVEPTAAMLFGGTWYKASGLIACSADVETAVDAAFRVTYPGDPARAGQYAVIRAYAELSMTYSVANVEGGIALYASVAPAADHAGTRLRWARNRAPASASTMFATEAEATARWPADQPVEFRVVIRFSSAGNALIYNNPTADYVSRIGYQVIGFTSSLAATLLPAEPPAAELLPAAPKRKRKRKVA